MSPLRHGERAVLQRRHASPPDSSSHFRVKRSPKLLGGVKTDALDKLHDGLSSVFHPPPTPGSSSTSGPESSPTSSPTHPNLPLTSIIDGLLGSVVGAGSKVVGGLTSSPALPLLPSLTPSLPLTPSLTPTSTNPINQLTDSVNSVLTNVVGAVSSTVDSVNNGLSSTLPIPPVIPTTTTLPLVVTPTTTNYSVSNPLTLTPSFPSAVPTTTPRVVIPTTSTNYDHQDLSSTRPVPPATPTTTVPPPVVAPTTSTNHDDDGLSSTRLVPSLIPTTTAPPVVTPTMSTHHGGENPGSSSYNGPGSSRGNDDSTKDHRGPSTTLSRGNGDHTTDGPHKTTSFPTSDPNGSSMPPPHTIKSGGHENSSQSHKSEPTTPTTPSSSIHNSHAHPGSRTTRTIPRTGTTSTDAATSTCTTAIVASTSSLSGTVSQSVPTIGTLTREPLYGVRLSSVYGFTTTTDSNGQSIVVSGTYTSYIGSPTGGGGGRGNGSPHGLLGGIGIGGLAAIIAIVILIILTCVVILLRRYHARRRAERLQGWFATWRRNHEERGIEGGPHMAQRRPLSDASFGTPEHPLSRSVSLARSLPYAPSCTDPFAANELISVSSSFSDQSRNPHPPRVPVAPAALALEQGDFFEGVSPPAALTPPVSPPSPGPMTPQPTLSTAPTAFLNQVFRNWRNSQLTIKPVPFKSNGRIVISRASSTQSLRSQSDQNHFVERRGSIMTCASGEYTAKSVDLMAFPRPPSHPPATYSNAASSILDPMNASHTFLQSRWQPNTGAGDIPATPARSDFNFPIRNFGPCSPVTAGESDPFIDAHEPLPSPMPSSAVQSVTFPGDGSDAHRPMTQPSNLTRIARSWTPSSPGDVAEELAVIAGDTVRVISRHPIMHDGWLRDSDVQGGWALVKRMDPETGISKRGYVPINCLMDVQGPSREPLVSTYDS